MPCTICKDDGCRADICQSFVIEQQFMLFCGTFAQQVDRTLEFRNWMPYAVSGTARPIPNSRLYIGEPDTVRRNLVEAREKYLRNKVSLGIRKTLIRVTKDWSIGLFKRVFPRFLEYIRTSYSLTDVDEFNRLLAEPNLISPRTCIHYKKYASSLAIWLMRKSLPENFLDLSNVHYRDLRPPARQSRIVYRDRVEIRTTIEKTKVTMNMCGSDEKYMIDDTCPICMDDAKPNNVVAFTCGHAFCCDCSVECLKRHRKCPMCRTKTTDVKFKAEILPEKFNALMAVVK